MELYLNGYTHEYFACRLLQGQKFFSLRLLHAIKICTCFAACFPDLHLTCCKVSRSPLKNAKARNKIAIAHETTRISIFQNPFPLFSLKKSLFFPCLSFAYPTISGYTAFLP
jgi:hypothetical protein